MNKRFFKVEVDLSLKSILENLDISEEIFLNIITKIKNIRSKINQFSSLENSSDDSLIFLNKSSSEILTDVKGICLIKIPAQEYNFQNNFVIPSENPKLDFCKSINKFCKKKEIKSEMRKINNSLISHESIIVWSI